MGQLIYAEETYAIRGAVFDVYRELGSGFLEAVYQECLEKEFKRRSLPYLPQQELKLTYKGDVLLQTYKADFVCFGKIIVAMIRTSQQTREVGGHRLPDSADRKQRRKTRRTRKSSDPSAFY